MKLGLGVLHFKLLTLIGLRLLRAVMFEQELGRQEEAESCDTTESEFLQAECQLAQESWNPQFQEEQIIRV